MPDPVASSDDQLAGQEPLSMKHAPSMIEVLAEPSLYDYTGGEIPSLKLLENAMPHKPLVKVVRSGG